MSVVPCAPAAIAADPLTPTDWCINQVNGPRECESLGAVDDRNPLGGAAGPRHGARGLCTTGRNADTGMAAPVLVSGVGARITRIDVCAQTTTERGGPACPGAIGGGAGAAPIGLANPDCDNFAVAANNPGDCTDDQAWDVTIGAYACAVPTTGSTIAGAPAGTVSTMDFAVYYDEYYAYWSYDGDGSYSNHGLGIAGMDGIANNDDNPPLPPQDGDEPGGPWTSSDEMSAFHGHVSGGIAAAPAPGTGPMGLHLYGSFVTTSYASFAAAEVASHARYGGVTNVASGFGGAAWAAAGTFWDDGINSAANTPAPFPTGLSNNCGASPSEGNLAPAPANTGGGDGMDPGPVVRAP